MESKKFPANTPVIARSASSHSGLRNCCFAVTRLWGQSQVGHSYRHLKWLWSIQCPVYLFMDARQQLPAAAPILLPRKPVLQQRSPAAAVHTLLHPTLRTILSRESVYVWKFRHQPLHPLKQLVRLAAALHNAARREASIKQLPSRALAAALHNLLRQNSFQTTQDAFSAQEAVTLHNLLLLARSLGRRWYL